MCRCGRGAGGAGTARGCASSTAHGVCLLLSPVQLFIVDAFVRGGRPYTGNPAAVCLLEEDTWPNEAWMQNLAEEMNLSETAFVLPTAELDRFGLRWFTPLAEVELCGHATLASAHALAEAGRVRGRVRFDLKWHGEVGVRQTRSGLWQLGFPKQRCAQKEAPTGLLASLGLETAVIRYVGFGPYDWIVEVSDPSAVAGAEVDFAALAEFEARGIAVCAMEAPTVYVCRFFAPSLRVAEDPATGSLQCVLGPHFAGRTGGGTFLARQLSRRGGELAVKVAGNRVRIAGSAVTVLRGALANPATP